MDPTPQQIEEDVFIGPCQRPPSKLEVASRRYGLLEDLIVLGYVPVPEAVIRGVGLVHQDRRHQLFQKVSLFKLRGYTHGLPCPCLGTTFPSEVSPCYKVAWKYTPLCQA